LLQFLFENSFNFLDLFIVVFLDFAHCFRILPLLKNLLIFQVVVPLL
jgi:hypothetical protein